MAYYKKVDGLRFVAISLVMIEHFAHYLSKNLSLGYFGVDLFFVISGFLITGILLKSNNASFTSNYYKFIGRRTIRIFPLYYITIFILWVLKNPDVTNNLIWLLTYSYNYAIVIKHIKANAVSHFWSLAVEEQFYLFWPIIVLLLKSKPKILLITIVGFITFGYGQMIFNIIPEISKFNYVGLPTRMASLTLGAFGSLFVYLYGVPQKILNDKRIEVFMYVFGIVLLFISLKFKVFFLGMCSLYFVLKAAYSDFYIKKINDFLLNDKVVGIGIVSYGIYVFHKPIAYYFGIYIFDPIWNVIDFGSLGIFKVIKYHSWIIKLPLYSGISILVAKLSFKYFETPLLKLKDKYFRYN